MSVTLSALPRAPSHTAEVHAPIHVCMRSRARAVVHAPSSAKRAVQLLLTVMGGPERGRRVIACRVSTETHIVPRFDGPTMPVIVRQGAMPYRQGELPRNTAQR